MCNKSDMSSEALLQRLTGLHRALSALYESGSGMTVREFQALLPLDLAEV